MSSASEPQYVTLKDGFTTPIAPVLLALDLERRGCSIECIGDDLFIRPSALLTDDDRAAIRSWKAHLIALVQRCEAIQ